MCDVAGDVGYQGHPSLLTPNIDRLARRGAQLSQFYSGASICSPSRAALLTGKYPVRTGVFPGNFGPDSSSGLRDKTIAEELAERGYRTAMVISHCVLREITYPWGKLATFKLELFIRTLSIASDIDMDFIQVGKWHLGAGVDGEHLPVRKGFHSWLGIPYSHDMCSFRSPCHPPDVRCSGRSGGEGRFPYCSLYNDSSVIQQPLQLINLTQTMTNFALDFMSNSLTKEAPFFLFYAFPQPHHPQFCGAGSYGRSRHGEYGWGKCLQ